MVPGFCEVEVLVFPKSQLQLTGVPVEISVNCTGSGAHPVNAEAVKSAVTCALDFADIKTAPSSKEMKKLFFLRYNKLYKDLTQK